MLKIWGRKNSSNVRKALWIAEELGLPYESLNAGGAFGINDQPDYLAKNPNGRIPALELEDGSVLAESNAILFYLAEGTPFFPADAWQRAQALSWMFFEQYSHEPYIAVARFIRGWTPVDSPCRADLPRLVERGEQALAVMEKYLDNASWFSGSDYGIADIALFAYTDCAGDGGFNLAKFPLVSNWLSRIRATAGFVPMPAVSAEVAARLALP